PQRLEPSVEIARVVDEPISSTGRLAGVAHPDQVGGEAAVTARDVGDDVAPEIGRRRVAVQEDDRIPGACVDVGHLGVEDSDTLSGVWVSYGKWAHPLDCSPPGSS